MSNAPPPGSADPLALRGVVPPMLTIFDEDGDVDAAETAAHAAFVADAGVHAVFPLGTNGEFPLLSADEREHVVAAVADAVDVPVIAGVGAPGTRRTVANAERAVAAGADGVVVVTPFYYPLDDEAARTHYRRVVEAVEVPVYGYQIPGRTGNRLSHDALDDLAALEGFAGMKDSSKDVPWLGRAVDEHPELSFLVGSDSLLVPGLDLGCAGIVSALSNAFPELVVELYEAYDAGDRERAEELQTTAYRARHAIKQGPYLAGVKAALSLRDDVAVSPGAVREPLRDFDPSERSELASTLLQLGLLDSL